MPRLTIISESYGDSAGVQLYDVLTEFGVVARLASIHFRKLGESVGVHEAPANALCSIVGEYRVDYMET